MPNGAYQAGTCASTNAPGKPLPAYAAIPVGPPSTFTVSSCFRPDDEYSVLVELASFDVHHGPVGVAAIPHTLTSEWSTFAARRCSSETRPCTTYALRGPPPSASVEPATMPARTSAARAATRIV